MRFVSYNILDGGEGRADPLAEVIEAQKPDVIGLVEAEDLSVIERLAGRFGMDFIQGVGKEGKASAILSRWPMVESINHGAIEGKLTRSFVEATVRTPRGGEVPVGVVHLCAGAYEGDEKVREGEIEIVLRAMERHRDAKRAHVLMGDFNSNSPVQAIDPEKCKEKTREAWRANGGLIPRRVITRLLEAGYLDVFHVANPETAPMAGTFTTQFPGQRVDYIFIWPAAAGGVKRAWIEYDRLATYASDHYPICVEME